MEAEDKQTDSMLQPQKRRSRGLAQELVEFVTEQIQNGVLRPGDKLPTEAEFVRKQGVSRAVVREAMSRLQAVRLVETRHGIGTFVLEPTSSTSLPLGADTLVTIRDVLAMLELRISVEVEAAGLAALRRSEEHLNELRRTLDAFQAVAAEGRNCVSEDLQFHLQVATATGNRYFPDFINYFGQAVIPRTRIDSVSMAKSQRRQYYTHINREHEEILKAIARQDIEGARAAMRNHLSNSRERIRSVQESAELNREGT